MKLHSRRKSPTEELKSVAIAALINALDEKREEKPKRGLTGVRALTAGLVIYTAGHAAYTGQRLVRERLSAARSDEEIEDVEEERDALEAQDPDSETEYDAAYEEEEPEAVEDEDEPEALEDEDEPEPVEDEDEPEPVEDEAEPEASEDEDEPESSEEESEDGEAAEPEAAEEPAPRARRKPARPAARKKSAQPRTTAKKSSRSRSAATER